MRSQFALAVFGVLLITTTVWAQLAVPPAPWRGAGTTPCVGSEGGVYQCAPAPRVVAVRAGRLFDSKSGQMLTRQVVLLQGERITDVGPEAQVNIPTGAQVINLSQATILPGLIDAHTHMFNNPKSGDRGWWPLSRFHAFTISHSVLRALLLDGGAGQAEAFAVVTLNI